MAYSADAVGAKSNKRSLFISRTWCYIVLTIFAVIALTPFFFLVINMTRAHSDITKGFTIFPSDYFKINYKSVMENAEWKMLSSLKNSFIVSTLTAFISTYFSSLTAYAIHAYRFKLRKPVFSFILMIMMIPSQVSALGFVKLVAKMELTNSFIPLIVPAIAAPATFFFMKQYMDSALPLDIIEAARIDGSGEFRTFNKLVLPIMKPAIAVQAIFSFVGTWNNYFVPALIIDLPEKRTLPIVIALIRGADYARFDMGAIYMAIGISILPVALVYLILSRFIIRGIALGAVKG